MAIYRGTLLDFDDSTYLARVRVAGSTPRTLENVRAIRLDTAEFVPGRHVIVDTGDHGDPADAVITAIYE